MPETLPPLTFADALDRSAVVAAAHVVADLVDRPEVLAAWDAESSCPGMSVGALAYHLTLQPQRTVEVLGAPAPPASDGPHVTVDEHYAQATWIQEDLDGPSNVAVRTRSRDAAEHGPAVVRDGLRASLARLDAVLAEAGPRVLVPWTGAVMATDDFLVTRLLEIVVHTDDLASSVDLPTPDLPAGAAVPVLRVLTDLAVRRHGQAALVRALSRPQRAPGVVAAF
ncbi:maleylpyruvate isomerase N-terminal domain-containing protein [Cellulomonas telluris]|uniref:maleylpyruvate isomerase N-terminal domain-containing protein n=1 Tax=Cellulomonas telluris TaxID=2306636 RepID=UPI0010A907DC|nr:maleylpyruvate isomerase N-terminal domain-containing protein [Cellulomonas telluris]